MPKKPLAWVKEKAPYAGLSDCMICISHKPNNYGYPQITHNGRVTSISRLVCQRRHPQMGGLHSLHACDNRACINPDHIRPGTRLENIADKIQKGRAARGEKFNKSKLTEEQARQVYDAPGKLREIAAQFGIGITAVHDIKKRINWKHIHAS